MHCIPWSIIGDEKEHNSARVELAHQEKKTCPAIDSDKKKHLSKGIEHAVEHKYVPKQKNEQSSSHLCHLICERHSFVACATPFLHILNMAAAVWQLVNENDGACVIAVFNAVLHCHA